MKNDLTRDEWLVLAEWFSRESPIICWIDEGTLGKNMDLFDSARNKIEKVAKELKGEL